MAEEPKKISFAFSKLSKKPSIVAKKPTEPQKMQLIDCLEGQNIKIKDVVEVEVKPLVIPIRDSTKNLLERVNEAKKLKEKFKKLNETDDRPDSELTIDELAARELIRDAQKIEELKKDNTKVHSLPMAEDKFIADGKEEPTMNDYEDVPINDFGMAMLRGMGWSEQGGIGKNPKPTNKAPLPDLRPKGLGLGADRMAKAAKPKISLDKDGKELQLEKGGYAKIIAGAHIGKYCEVQGFDDEAGRVIAKTALKGEILTLNEFLIVPVNKDEYVKNSKVINNAKYNEFKEKEATTIVLSDSPEPSKIKLEGKLQNIKTVDVSKNGKGESSRYGGDDKSIKMKCRQYSSEDERKRNSRSSSNERYTSRKNSRNTDRGKSESSNRRNNFASSGEDAYKTKSYSKNTEKYKEHSKSHYRKSRKDSTSSNERSASNTKKSYSRSRRDSTEKDRRPRSYSRSGSEERHVSKSKKSKKSKKESKRNRSRSPNDKYKQRDRSSSPEKNKRSHKKKSKKHSRTRSSSNDDS